VLISAKADPTVRRNDGGNAMHCAIEGSATLKSDNDDKDDRLALYNLLISSGTSILALDEIGNLPWDKAVQYEDLEAIYIILRSGSSEAYRNVRFLPSAKQGKKDLQDASHLIFLKATLHKNYRLLRELVVEDRMGNDSIILNDIFRIYINSRNSKIPHNEALNLYKLAKSTFDSKQRYPLREGEKDEPDYAFLNAPLSNFLRLTFSQSNDLRDSVYEIR
jgi:hypothetical protein